MTRSTSLRIPTDVLPILNKARYEAMGRTGRHITQGEWQRTDPRITGLYDDMVGVLRECIDRLGTGQPATKDLLSRARTLLKRIDEAEK